MKKNQRILVDFIFLKYKFLDKLLEKFYSRKKNELLSLVAINDNNNIINNFINSSKVNTRKQEENLQFNGFEEEIQKKS
jgi:hypothetical protein